MADLLGKLVVRSHAPRRRAVLLASAAVLGLAVPYGAFELGRYDAGFRVVDSVRGAWACGCESPICRMNQPCRYGIIASGFSRT